MNGKKYQQRTILDKKDREGMKFLLAAIEARRLTATEKPPTLGMDREGDNTHD